MCMKRKTNSNRLRTFSKCLGLKLMLIRRKTNRNSWIRPPWINSMKEISRVGLPSQEILTNNRSLKIRRKMSMNIRRALKSQRMTSSTTQKIKRQNSNRSSTGSSRSKFRILWSKCRANLDNIGISWSSASPFTRLSSFLYRFVWMPTISTRP